MEEIKPKEKPGDNGKPETLKDFKLCEIWIRNGQLQVDGSDAFWEDKVRALGTLEYCKDIIKYREPPKEEKSKIIPNSHGIMDFVRGGFKGKRK